VSSSQSAGCPTADVATDIIIAHDYDGTGNFKTRLTADHRAHCTQQQPGGSVTLR
jgi:hypothetical protein